MRTRIGQTEGRLRNRKNERIASSKFLDLSTKKQSGRGESKDFIGRHKTGGGEGEF